MDAGTIALVWLIELSIFGIALFAGYRFARGGKLDTSKQDALREQIGRVSGEFKDYRDDVRTQFAGVNSPLQSFNQDLGEFIDQMDTDAKTLLNQDLGSLLTQTEQTPRLESEKNRSK